MQVWYMYKQFGMTLTFNASMVRV